MIEIKSKEGVKVMVRYYPSNLKGEQDDVYLLVGIDEFEHRKNLMAVNDITLLQDLVTNRLSVPNPEYCDKYFEQENGYTDRFDSFQIIGMRVYSRY